jgi:hypothetical protein
MKFLIALTVLTSATAFAQTNGNHYGKIKCYEPAEQGRRGDVALVLQKINPAYPSQPVLQVVHPFQAELYTDGECFETRNIGTSTDMANLHKFELCQSQGQRINGLVPFEYEVQGQEETVYCDSKILRYLER